MKKRTLIMIFLFISTMFIANAQMQSKTSTSNETTKSNSVPLVETVSGYVNVIVISDFRSSDVQSIKLLGVENSNLKKYLNDSFETILKNASMNSNEGLMNVLNAFALKGARLMGTTSAANGELISTTYTFYYNNK